MQVKQINESKIRQSSKHIKDKNNEPPPKPE